MTNKHIVPSILNIKSVGIDITNDLKAHQTKTIAQCLYDEINSIKTQPSEKEQEENNKEKN